MKIFEKQNLIILFEFLILHIIVSHLLSFISSLTKHDDLNNIDYLIKNNQRWVMFVASVLIAPVFETLVAQDIVFKIVERNVNSTKRKWVAIIISAIVFALFHWYNFFAVFAGFCSGLIFAFNYSYFQPQRIAFVQTVLLHSLYNLYAFIFNLIDK